ncbi:ATP-binding protein [uncultured Psychrobacillus sp.]|uniref:ATP-binding protein n=1 Tax=uncultured Psychrobacillus sp. TaxID=1551585 RepID=UPI002629B31F|nr:ATP-binding protein [uncultured Psychrobacillus sp.]
MQINLFDEKECLVQKLDYDFDSIMENAESQSGDTFSNAVQLIEQAIMEEWEYEISPTPSSIVKYLKSYAALGYANEPLAISVIKRIEGNAPMKDISSTTFEEIIHFPNEEFQGRYHRLVGLDNLKSLIQKEGATIMAPEILRKWSNQYHNKMIEALQAFSDRYPFFIFEGDVGTGKTEFAMTFGSELAQFTNQEIILARMSMKSRGNGVVGEISKLITKSFQDARQIASSSKKPVIMLLDEADSLAQSREENQMHHEDRAGVNALIQGIDHIRSSEIPILVVFCTNRLGAIDPAIKRRAALVHTFSRPNLEQRYEVFQKYFGDIALTPKELALLAQITGENEKYGYGFTYSDLLTRVVPQSILYAYPDKPVTFDIIEHAIQSIKPSAPFVEQSQKGGNDLG